MEALLDNAHEVIGELVFESGGDCMKKIVELNCRVFSVFRLDFIT